MATGSGRRRLRVISWRPSPRMTRLAGCGMVTSRPTTSVTVMGWPCSAVANITPSRRVVILNFVCMFVLQFNQTDGVCIRCRYGLGGIFTPLTYCLLIGHVHVARSVVDGYGIGQCIHFEGFGHFKRLVVDHCHGTSVTVSHVDVPALGIVVYAQGSFAGGDGFDEFTGQIGRAHV